MQWSLSKLTTFEQCAAKGNYRYNEKLPEEKGGAAQRGIDKHKIVELYLTTPESVELPPELLFYKGFFDDVRKVKSYAEYKIALNENWEPCEWDTGWARCVLDLLILEGEESATIYDWKTGKIYPEHEDQKDLYAAFVLCAFPKVQNVRAIHVYLDLARNREKLYWRGMVDGIKERWARRAAAVANLVEFIPNPSFMCRYCSFSRFKGGPCRF